MIVHPLITFSDLCDTNSALKYMYIHLREPHAYTPLYSIYIHNMGKFKTPMYCLTKRRNGIQRMHPICLHGLQTK